MTMPSKILWSEGMTLRPQQFQQQDRYHEARLHRIASALHPQLWGVCHLEWNREGLAGNSLRADAMSLIFQDGEIVDAPDADELPEPVDLSELPLDGHSFTFYAALPLLKGHGGNLAGFEKAVRGARYTQAEFDTADLFTEAMNADISYLGKRVELLDESAHRGAYVHFPVARLRRLASGGFEMDPAFVPPSVHIGAAGLARLLDNLMQKLKAKLDALVGDQREPSKDVLEVRSGDAASFWLLHTISSAYAALGHFAACKALHPERLFETMLALAGGLMTFSKKYDMADLPRYRHADPGPGFARLDGIIRDLVDTVISAKYFMIPLSKEEGKQSHYQGSLASGKIDGQTLLCLGVRADMPALELVAAVPLRFKAGAPDDVNRSVLSALPGVGLTHLPQVPAAIPVRPGTYYFALEHKSQLYENMLRAQSISIYVPEGLAGLKLELIAITS
jgi:type VI secretion system protein ImpJ